MEKVSFLSPVLSALENFNEQLSLIGKHKKFSTSSFASPGPLGRRLLFHTTKKAKVVDDDNSTESLKHLQQAA